MLELEEVHLAYGSRVVVERFSCRIEPGEFVALIGPNGAGKSALLRSMARLLKPRSGHILLGGRDLWRMNPREVARTLAWISPSEAYPADLTVLDLLARARYPYRRGFRGSPRDGDVIAWAIELAELGHLQGRRLSALSAGELQRVTLAAGLAQEPNVMLLDEPTAFLDLQHALEVLELLVRLNREQGLTVVVALHDLMQAARHASRVLLLGEGILRADGPAASVLVPEVIGPVFGVDVVMLEDPVTGTPLPIPSLRESRRAPPLVSSPP